MSIMLTPKVLPDKGLRVFVPAGLGVKPHPTSQASDVRPSVGVKLDRDAVLMALAGWSSARIARAYGVTQSAAWRYLARRRAGARGYRPIWRWGSCSGCGAWGWFRLTPARRKRPPSNLAGRWFCSVDCYRGRGTDPALALAALKRPRRGGKGKRRTWFVKATLPASPQAAGATNAGASIP